MTLEKELPILLWPVSCFDRRRKNPLPVYNRWHWLDWSRLTPHQTFEILAIANAKKNMDPPYKPVSFDEAVITRSIGTPNNNIHMLQYRRLFTEIPNNDVESFLNHPARHNRIFQTVSFSAEYFEDETGTPITNYEIMRHVSGQKFPIIAGKPESILKIGPVSASNTSNWSVNKANTLAQFLDIVQRIYTSNWYLSPKSITSLVHKTGDRTLLAARFPDDENTMSVLAYFRQLHAGDKLLENACDVYISHAGDTRKQWWIDERKQSFLSLIDSPPMPYNTNKKSRRQIVRMFMYGAGLLHSSSHHGDDVALDTFISDHGKHDAVMIFNSCLMDFFRVAVTIHPVIHQDFEHWINIDHLTPASRVGIPNLFSGFTLLPNRTKK